MPIRTNARSRGFSLIELMVALAISVVIIALTTKVFIGMQREQTYRQKVTEVQSTARMALSWLEMDLREAALGAGTGVVWVAGGADAVRRPAVQIFRRAPGGGFLDVKANSSAVLMVQALPAPRAAVVGAQTTSTVSVPVTDATGFAKDDPVLFGDYGDASWGVLADDPSGGMLALKETTVNVFPGQQVRELPSGAYARRARVRLYYLNARDQLVRAVLSVPRAPASFAEVISSDVLGEGFEDIQFTCQMDGGAAGFGACPPAIAAADPIHAESTAAFGAFDAGMGPLLTGANVGALRTIVVNAVVRSRGPLVDLRGDPKIPLDGVALPVGGGDDADPYIRRPYTVTAAVRNTSLGVF